MKTPLDNDLNKVYESFNQDHDNLRDKLMASLPVRSKPHKGNRLINLVQLFIRGDTMKVRITKLAAAAVIIIGVLIVADYFGVSVDGSSISWADVVERFRSVPFFSATLYMKNDATAQPDQIELWMNQKCLSRLRFDDQVVFGQKGKVTKAFDIKHRSEVEPDHRAVALVRLMGQTEGFSLETVMRGISGGKLVNVTPLVNAEAVISEDLVVFDVQHEQSPGWLRIWALRESKLPVHIRVWDPSDGENVDVIFTYSKEQQESFFDPEAFSAGMKSLRRKEMNLAYMFLKDPGGKQIFPGSINESEAFQVVTQTIDGKPWSLADHSGKVVLIIFWDKRTIGTSWVSHSKDIYERFRDHADFLMVGVALDAKAETVKDYCRKRGMKWLQLHEPGKKRQNSLARAFGIGFRRSAWLIKKDGSTEELFALEAGVIEGALFGLTYNSHMWICKMLQERAKRQPLTLQDFDELCGSSYTVDYTPIGRKRRNYRRYNEDKTRVSTIFVELNKDGTMAAWGSGSSLVDPAEVTVSFSSEYIKENIENQVEPEIRAKLFNEYIVTFSAEAGNKEYPLCWKTSIQPEQSYTTELFPGTYDFVVRVFAPSDRAKSIKIIRLLKDVKLTRDEKKTIRFE